MRQPYINTVLLHVSIYFSLFMQFFAFYANFVLHICESYVIIYLRRDGVRLMNIGNRIKQRRLELNLSVDDLAKKLNKNRATIYRYESNDIENFPTTVVEPLAKALETTPAYLMGWEQKWDMETQQFEDKINAFFYQLRGLGWTYEWSYNDKMYLFSNGITSMKITAEEYGILVDQSEEFCKRQLQKLLLKSSSLLNAAHERTDIEITEEMKQHDDDIMDNDDLWK